MAGVNSPDIVDAGAYRPTEEKIEIEESSRRGLLWLRLPSGRRTSIGIEQLRRLR